MKSNFGNASYAASLVLALCACRSDTPSSTTPSTSSVDSGQRPVQSSVAIGEGPSMGPRSHGVPHSNNIDLVALSPDGKMAMSRDSLGGLRFWPSLAGDAEPVLIPIRGARSFSLARAEKGYTLAIIDGVGALHILAAQPDTSVRELYMSSPHSPILQAEVLEGGARIVSLSSDHKISLLNLEGQELSIVQERRFRPSSLRLRGDHKSLFALSTDASTQGMSVSLRALAIDLASDSLALQPDESSVDRVFHVDEKRFALSPDGTKLAYLGFPAPEAEPAGPAQKPTANRAPMVPPRSQAVANTSQPSLLVATLATGDVETVELSLPAHELMQVSLGFVANDAVIISSRPSGGSWRIELGPTIKSYPLASVVANDPQRSAHDYAGGTHLAADGTWLFVQDPIAAKHHYLGYGMFDPQFASLSPDTTRVAWTTSQMVFVESVRKDEQSLRITAPPTEAYFRSAFVDDKHLIAVDYSGGLHLIDWKLGKEVGSVDTGGAIREFEVDQNRKLARGIRQNGGSWVVELQGGALQGPYFIQDQGYRSGFLGGAKTIWTVDSQSRYHSYSLEELRAGLSSSQLKAEVKALSAGVPLAIDDQGHRYFAQAKGSSATLTIKDSDEKELSSFEIPWTPMQTHPSPDGTRIALVASSGAIIIYERATGKALWSMSLVQGFRHLSWSKDSKTVAVASQVGAAIHEAESGDQIRLGCGPWFEKRSTPPSTTVSFMQVQNLCER